jgi:hypothetical protein
MAADSCVDGMRITHRDTDLADPPHGLSDQALMSAMKRLIAPDEQGCRFLWIEGRPQSRQRLLGPIMRRPLRADAQVELFWRNEHPVGVRKTAGLDPIGPDRECLTECLTRLACSMRSS